jgi:hypothetical protein
MTIKMVATSKYGDTTDCNDAYSYQECNTRDGTLLWLLARKSTTIKHYKKKALQSSRITPESVCGVEAVRKHGD